MAENFVIMIVKLCQENQSAKFEQIDLEMGEILHKTFLVNWTETI